MTAGNAGDVDDVGDGDDDVDGDVVDGGGGIWLW